MGNAGKSITARAVLISAGIATVAIAAIILLATRPYWWPDHDLPETDHKPDAWSSQDDAPLPVEGPAAEFQAELYGIAEPLVQRLPNSTRARCLLASVHRRFARTTEAARELQQCLALDPACAEAHYSLALMALDVGDYPLAEKHLRDALDMDPRWANVPLRLAQAQMSQGEFRDAASTLEKYLKLDPRDGEAWCHLGQAYQKLGDFDKAKRCHLTAIEFDPDSIEAHYGVAIALRELGATEEAREYFEKFGQMRSSMTATVRSNHSRWTDEDFVHTAIVDMATKAGAVYAMHGCLAEAEESWTKATTLDPALTKCQEMLCRLRPDNSDHWLRLGLMYIQGGRPMEAEAPFQRAIELAPQRADGYAGLAQVYMLLGKNTEEAAELARTAVKLEATAPNYFVLAAACERLEDRPGAESALEHAIKLDPADSRYSEAYDKLKDEQCP